MTIVCNFCERTYKTKFNYIHHLKRLHLEDDQNNNQDIYKEINYVHNSDIGKVICDKCNKSYANQYALNRHQSDSCTMKKSINKDRYNQEIIITKISQMIHLNELDLKCMMDLRTMLDDKINLLIGGNYENNKESECQIFKANDINNSNINSHIIKGDHGVINNLHNTQNINITLKLSNFGKEKDHYLGDIDFASDFFNFLSDNLIEDKRRYGGGWRIDQLILHKALVKIFKYIHCNADFPENQNIYVTNKKYWLPFKVFKSGEWVLGNTDDLKDAVISNQDRFIRLIDILIENNPEETPTLKKIKEAFGYEKDVKHEAIARDFFHESYNHKKMIGRTYEQTYQSS